jgi:O-antigen ligase
VIPNTLVQPGAVLVRRRAVPLVSGAATVVALYIFLVISRVPELVTPLQHVRPILLVSLLMIVMAFTVAPRPREGPLSFTEMRAVLALMTLAILGIPFSVWPGLTVAFVVKNLFKLVLLFTLVLHAVRTLQEVQRVAWAIVGAALTLAVATLLFNVANRARVTSTYDANDLAFVMVCALPLSLCLAFGSSGLPRLLAGLAAFLAPVVVVQTGSRGGFLSVVAVGFLLAISLPVRRLAVRLVPILLGAAILGGIASDAYWDRMATIWGSGTDETSDYTAGGIREARLRIWQRGIGLMLANPLLGIGGGAFEIAEGETHGAGIWRAAHNSFIEVGAELGLAGLALFVFLVIRAMRNCWVVIRTVRHDPERRTTLWLAYGLGHSVIAYAIVGSGLSHGYSTIFYVLLALSAVLRRLIASPAVNAMPIPSGGGAR